MTIGITGNLAKTVLPDVATNLIMKLKEIRIDFVVEEKLASLIQKTRDRKLISSHQKSRQMQLPKRCDILVAFGGDGTILATARLVGKSETPILGVNLGKLGFLAEFAVEEMDEWIQSLLSRKYKVESRMVVRASTKSGRQREFFGLNDIVIDKSGSSRVIDLQTFVNGEYLNTYTADGLIIATPTGSTAYSLATGGPIVVPDSKAITLSPIGPHTLTARPVIVPDDSVIRVVVERAAREVHITADGQVEEILHPPVEFVIKKASYSVKLVKRPDRSYYDLLRTKLMWGRDVRVELSEEQ